MRRREPTQAKRSSTAPDTGDSLARVDPRANGHLRWALLWHGTMKLLQKREPRAFRRLQATLERFELAGPLVRIHPWERFSERIDMRTGVLDDFQELPASLARACSSCWRPRWKSLPKRGRRHDTPSALLA
jgi:hypothetical protein